MSSRCSTPSCGAPLGSVRGDVRQSVRFDGELLHFVARLQRHPRGRSRRSRRHLPGSAGRALVDRRRSSSDAGPLPDVEHARWPPRRPLRWPSRLPQRARRTACCAKGLPIGVIGVRPRPSGPFSDEADRAARHLRGPGRHRHRERPPVQGARARTPRADAFGGASSRRSAMSAGRSADARPRHGARDHRDPRQPTRRDRRLLDLRVRRGHARLSGSVLAALQTSQEASGRAGAATPIPKGEGLLGRVPP